ncbi:MAG: diguanylate cyclase [Eubacterium sp.]|jgi:diguanylate cyclase (GGDEF)-like protein|nr:diguanylate cyclase [Eubacterium sp.]
MLESQKNKLLIVDDQKSNLMVLTNILISEYTVYTAKDGIGAIKKAKEYLPDLILLDIIMPGMDGYEVLTTLKEINETKHIPIIFITGLSSPEDEQKGLSYDAADYISKPFNSEIVKLRVRHQIRIVNQLRTIERLTLTDQLTDLPNRRSFDSRISLEWDRAIREKTPISVLIMDLDKFKQYNDAYGHQQGDLLLQSMAGVFKTVFKRSTDFVARWGGEEFLALLAGIGSEEAMQIAEQIRERVEAMQIPCPSTGKLTEITISIGVNTETPLPNSSIVDFIRRADESLYIAKQTGRNKVISEF